MSTVETKEERAAVVIPDDWRALAWPALKSLASKLSDAPVRDKEDAVKAVETEIAARFGLPVVEPDPPEAPVIVPPPEPPVRVIAPVTIPPDWHDTMSVAQIIDLARQIDPLGNPVEVIRAELARRS
jgi:hypothetical protein